MSLNILHLINKSAPPQPDSGGANRSVDWLAKAQAAAGHHVSIGCPQGHSTEYFRYLQVPENISIQEFIRCLPADIDIVHLHGGYARIQHEARNLGVPFVQTVRTNMQHSGDSPAKLSLHNAVFLSESHMRRYGGTRYIYNGIPTDDYIYSAAKQRYLLFLAKVKRSKKGVDDATRVARRMRFPLVVAGGRRLGTVSTWLPISRYVRSIGVVSGTRKLELLANATALLVPIRWEEPFGLTIPEALASGTPVIANKRGSMPELIDHGKTGFLCENSADMQAAIKNIGKLSPADCRNAAVSRFTIERVQQDYTALYQDVLAGAEW